MTTSLKVVSGIGQLVEESQPPWSLVLAAGLWSERY